MPVQEEKTAVLDTDVFLGVPRRAADGLVWSLRRDNWRPPITLFVGATNTF
jgi:hypothetical protein